MALDQEKMLGLMREILQEDYLELVVEAYTLEERLAEGRSRIRCEMKNKKGETVEVAGEGVGTIDAVFDAMRTYLAEDYRSLNSIRFSQFGIKGLISSQGDQESSKAEAQATVGIVNSEGREFIFQTKEHSVSRAGIQATVNATEYFVNSERTYVRLHEILNHYKKEGRTDLVEKYTDLMTQVVQNTSYSEVVERIREEMKG